jgi:MFS family permease
MRSNSMFGNLQPVPADPSTTSSRIDWRRIAVPAFGPSTAAAVGTGATIPVLALGARDLGATVSVAALAVAASLLAELVFAIPAGSVVSRVGERRALIAASLVDVVMSLGAWLAPGLPVFFAALFLSGFSGSVFLIARQGYLVQAVPVAARARAMSTLGGVHRIGMFIGPFIGAPVVHAFGPRAAFAVSAVAGTVAGLVTWLAPDITAAHEAAERAAPRRSTWEVLGSERRVLLTLGTGVLVIGAVRASRIGLVPLWAEHVGLTAAETSIVFGVAAGVEMLLFYPVGSVMDRHGRVWGAVPCVVVMGAAILALPHTTTLVGVAAVTVVAAIGNGLGSGIVMTLGADHAPEDGRPQFLGGWRFLSVVGGSGGPALISVVAGLAGLATAATIVGLLAILGAGWLGWWVSAFDAERRRGRMPRSGS